MESCRMVVISVCPVGIRTSARRGSAHFFFSVVQGDTCTCHGGEKCPGRL